MEISAQDVAERTEQLASFSDVAFRISEVLEDARSSAADIGALIEPDPALSAALLRIANSAAYSTRGQIDNITAAIRIVGSKHVRDLAYAISAAKAFDGIPNELISVEDFWRHSLYCAVAAQEVANRAKLCRATSLFTAGLLHDIGQLALFCQQPELCRSALRLTLESEEETAISHSEKAIFGFNHMDVGLALAESWGFPEPIRCAIGHHHEPSMAEGYGEFADVARIVNVANSIAVLAELGSTDLHDAPPIDEAAWTVCAIEDDAALAEIIEATTESASELLEMFVS